MPPKIRIKRPIATTEPEPSPAPEPAHAPADADAADISIGPFKLIPAGRNYGYFITGGDTYSIKEDLKSHGCTWNKPKLSWWIPPAKLEEVKEYLNNLVSIANKISKPSRPAPQPTVPAPAPGLVLAPAEKIKTFNDLMGELGVSDIKNITTLSADEIDYLISILTLHDGAEKLSDKVERMKIQLLIEELGGKLCRCIKKIVDKGEQVEKAAIPICISSIFVKKGLKISTFQCKNGELLLPKTGSKILLDRQPDKKSII